MFFSHKSSFKAPKIKPQSGRALVICTSHATLDTLDPESGKVIKPGKPTGVYASEMTEPYYVFLDAGLTVDVASIRGGEIPVEKLSLSPLVRTRYDTRYLKDAELQAKVAKSLCIDTLNFTDYDIIFVAGGWGAAYDLAQSFELAEKISEAYAAEKILGSVCHGALGFVSAHKPDGSPLLRGVRATAVTNRQLQQLGVTVTPKHPETELLRVGANYTCQHQLVEMTANHVVIDQGHRMVTAQNQKGGVEAAFKALEMLAEQQSGAFGSPRAVSA